MKNKKVGRRTVVVLLLLLTITFLIFCSIPRTAAQTETPKNITTEVPKPIIPKVLQAISWCESKDRQFNADGTVHRGEINPKDVGKYQINEFYHLEASIKLGMDIYTLEGNTAYALYLYEHEGTTPWNWSKSCWGSKEIIKN